MFSFATSICGMRAPNWSSRFVTISGYICAVSCRYFCVPEIKFGRTCSSAYEIRFVFIQSKYPVTVIIHNFQCGWRMCSIIQSGKLKQCKRNFDHGGCRDLEVILFFYCFNQCWEPMYMDSNILPFTPSSVLQSFFIKLPVQAGRNAAGTAITSSFVTIS